ncbi:hypothetical protein QN372_10200 [Undibacterium sp. RTI2.1]|uniref:hypothetical protein n=1 Tax=unclassified Undibacterium TaxID=2630295 RepID=UPI002AB37503|nr:MULTISPECIES: hypothetical protein [unclassified Undibacterium]MDY7540257.1 hypothetical protein [Undibacterium sp. 5I1]MEB0031119.1 hypothetical protein [Undibacterium sp. RTI2.1]MEB0115290.1 hypothetical protein [Undibacterium sp. RTI2.2]MEB0233114.1 hypothetical protein [Undibacterium sp. 10I3]MEB0259390.1 hypothetical protein [Undibacterium sp. 5I1]
MNIKINQDLRAQVALIDPLTPNEYEALERSILREGCRDALVLWGDTLIDGHNRYAICQQHGLPFNTVQNTSLNSMEDVVLWLIDNHIGRRSVTDFQRGMLALRKQEIVAARTQQQSSAAAESPTQDTVELNSETAADKPVEPKSKVNREDIAKAAGISSNAVTQIEKIQKAASPALVEAVRAGTISISAAAAIASLPSEQQIAAVAGGKKELQQAAKSVREMKSSNKQIKLTVPTEKADPNNTVSKEINTLQAEITRLNALVAMLTIENSDLVEHLTRLNAKDS